MSFTDSLQEISLDELMELFPTVTQHLLEAKINEDEEMVIMYQNTLEQIQEAIIYRRDEESAIK